MIEEFINSISYKEYEKNACLKLHFENYLPAIEFIFKGDGIRHEEQVANRASQEALKDYIKKCAEQERLARIYLSNYESIDKENILKLGRNKNIIV